MENMSEKHESEKINEYTEKGYTSSYQMGENGIKDLSSGIEYSSEEVNIEDEYRYEGMSNPSDLSILYVLSMPDNSKGTLLLPYGPSDDTGLGWFMKEVSMNNLNKDKTDLNKVSDA